MAAETAPHVQIYGLQVEDEAQYTRYREAMTPIFARFGGRFGFDLRVSEVLKNEAGGGINRLFSMRFPSASAAARFFDDPDYRAVRARLFEHAVSSVVCLAKLDEA
jgi:uncharacterized protein (DUF1330 family)